MNDSILKGRPRDAPATALPVGKEASGPGRITIRFTRSTEDIATRIELNRRAHEEIGDGLPFDDDMVRQFYERRVTRTDQCVLQAELNGKMIGGLTGVIGPHFHCSALGASLLGCYVLPEHRGSLAAIKLLHGFRRWALTNGAVRIYVGVTSGIDMARTDRLLRRLGFRVTGGNYVQIVSASPA